MSFKKQFKEELIDKNVWHCLNDTQIESIASMAEQQLQLYIVSQQRELLIAYNVDFYKGIHDVTLEHIEQKVDKYLSNL